MRRFSDYDLLIFDCDGVILDSNTLKIDAMRSALTEFDITTEEANRCALFFAENFGKSRFYHVDYYCLSHNNKFLSESTSYNTLVKPVILPKHRFSSEELALFSPNCPLMDYGLVVKTGEFYTEEKSCVIPFDITVAYAFSVAENMKANNVTLVGFNGYESNDTRQLEMLETLNLMQNFQISQHLLALTPTTYPIAQGSIYAPV